jgi:hypothetical protein
MKPQRATGVAASGPGCSGQRAESLQLDFLVQDVLARLRIELHEFELLGRGLLVLVAVV